MPHWSECEPGALVAEANTQALSLFGEGKRETLKRLGRAGLYMKPMNSPSNSLTK